VNNPSKYKFVLSSQILAWLIHMSDKHIRKILFVVFCTHTHMETCTLLYLAHYLQASYNIGFGIGLHVDTSSSKGGPADREELNISMFYICKNNFQG